MRHLNCKLGLSKAQEDDSYGALMSFSLHGASAAPFCLAIRRDGDVNNTKAGELAHNEHIKMGKKLLRSLVAAPKSTQITAHHGVKFELESLCMARISVATADRVPDLHQSLGDLKESTQKVGEELRVPVPRIKLPFIGQIRSLIVKQLICGIIAGAVSSVALAPFGILRTRVFTGIGGRSTPEVIENAIKHEGVRNLMQGRFSISLMLSALEKGVQFTTYEAVKRWEERKFGSDLKWLPKLPPRVAISTVAGALAGVASTLAIYPFQTLPDRLTLQPQAYHHSLKEAFLKVFTREGIAGLYHGITPALISMVPNAALTFYAYETLRRMHASECKGIEVWSCLLAGGIAGIMALSLTYPLEAMRKQMSLSAVKGPFGYHTMREAVQGIVRKEGLSGLYKGFPVEAARMVPYVALSFMVYEVAKRAFVAQYEERRDEVKDGDYPL